MIIGVASAHGSHLSILIAGVSGLVAGAMSLAASFAVGAALPVAMAMAIPDRTMIATVSVASLAFLALLGVVGAIAGGASPLKAAVRVMFWGALAMGITAGIGAIFGTQV